MTRRSLLTASLLLAAAAALPARADEFTPGHVFVGGRDDATVTGRVSEFDADLNHVRDIDLPDPPGDDDLSQIYGVAFGPDGLLYAGQISDGRVERVAPDGSFTAFIDEGVGLDRAAFVSFGPIGRLHVGSRGTSELLRREDGGTLTALDLPAEVSRPDAISFLPSGRRVVSHFSGDESARVIDAYGRASLRLDQTVTIVGFPANVVELRDGSILVPDYDGGVLLITHPDGRDSSAATHADMGGPFGIAVLGNGNVLISNWDNANLIELEPDGTHVRTLSHAGLLRPAQIAVAPYVFDAKLNGFVADEGSPQKKVKGQGLLVTVEINGGTVTVSVPETPPLFPVSGDWVLRGHVSHRDGDAKTRLLHSSMPGDHPDEGRGEIVLELKGREDDAGRFVPAKIKGTWHYSRGTTTFAGTVKGKR